MRFTPDEQDELVAALVPRSEGAAPPPTARPPGSVPRQRLLSEAGSPRLARSACRAADRAEPRRDAGVTPSVAKTPDQGSRSRAPAGGLMERNCRIARWPSRRENRRPASPLSCLSSSAAVLAVSACGGGSEGGRPVPPRRPAPAASAFQLLPARLAAGQKATRPGRSPSGLARRAGLVVERSAGRDRRRQRPGAGHSPRVAPSSWPRPRAASVAATTLTVFRITGPAPDSTSASLDRRRTRLRAASSAEEALTYKVLALFGDPRLPAAFAGAPERASPTTLLLRGAFGPSCRRCPGQAGQRAADAVPDCRRCTPGRAGIRSA